MVATGDGTSIGWWRHNWQCLWWSVAGLVLTLEKGEQERQPWKQGFAERARDYETLTTSPNMTTPLSFSCSTQWIEWIRVLGQGFVDLLLPMQLF